MKFFLAEADLGKNATRQKVDQLITLLRKKGWDVGYGLAKNRATDISEFGQEERLQSLFADDFMSCLAEIEGG